VRGVEAARCGRLGKGGCRRASVHMRRGRLKSGDRIEMQAQTHLLSRLATPIVGSTSSVGLLLLFDVHDQSMHA
jgi:hypothetical protein